MTRFSLPDSPHEYIHVCEECSQYLPCLDLVERSEPIDFDLAALGLVHLDAVAQSLAPDELRQLRIASETLRVKVDDGRRLIGGAPAAS